MKKERINIEIRSERPEDYHETEFMTMRAFWNRYTPGCDEFLLVRNLRNADVYLPEISRIALVDGHIVGTIMYSVAYCFYGETRKDIITFGPLCVDPAYQDYGIGGKLLETTMQLARDAGYEAIVIFGEPGYYPKHGFVTCDKLGLTTMEGENFDAFMGIELKPGALTSLSEKMGCKGKFTEADVMDDLSPEAADKMALEFERFLKLRIPCQWKFDNPKPEEDGYEIIEAVQYKPAFKNMFNIYAHELSEYNPALSLQVSRDGNYLEEQAEGYFADANKRPYVILCANKPAGLLVTAGYPAQDRNEKDTFGIEEFFITIPYRGKGIAGDIVQRIWKQASFPCELSILKKNKRAIRFFEKMIQQCQAECTIDTAEADVVRYTVKLPNV